MRLSRLAILVLPFAVSACSIPGLVAHGVKSYEKSRDGTGVAQPAPAPQVGPVAEPAAQAQPAPQPPPSTPAGGYRRAEVTVDPAN